MEKNDIQSVAIKLPLETCVFPSSTLAPAMTCGPQCPPGPRVLPQCPRSFLSSPGPRLLPCSCLAPASAPGHTDPCPGSFCGLALLSPTAATSSLWPISFFITVPMGFSFTGVGFGGGVCFCFSSALQKCYLHGKSEVKTSNLFFYL